MAREERLIRERINKDRIRTPALSANHVEYIKNVLIDVLRDVYSRHPKFTYIPDPDTGLPAFFPNQTVAQVMEPDLAFELEEQHGLNPNLGIVITDVFSYGVEFLPAITVRVSGSRLKDVSFNQNQFTFDYLTDDEGKLELDEFGRPIPLYQEFSGLYETDVTLRIHTWDPLAREQLVTNTALMFWHKLRNQLRADFGLQILATSVGGEEEKQYSNDYIYTQPIQLTILSSWDNRLPLGEEVGAVNIQIVTDAVQGTPRIGACQTTGIPTKIDVELSDRIDGIDEIRACPELVLEDALVLNTAGDDFVLTEDWATILVQCGVTLEESIVQINEGSDLRAALQEVASKLRERAITARNNKLHGTKSGTPAGITYKLQNGTTILSDDTVVFPNGVRVTSGGNVEMPVSGFTVTADGTITGPDNVDLDFGMNPFTALSFENMPAFDFFLILLFVDSPTRQSIVALNDLIDEFNNTLPTPGQVSIMEAIRKDINDVYEHRVLQGKVVDFDRPSF